MIPLVLVHGFMGGSEQWYRQSPLEEVAPLVCLDLPGFGKNADHEPMDDIGDFADWALNRVTALGIARFHLLGHSMGGMVVQEMVRRAPDRVERLLLCGTGAKGVLPGRFEPIDTSIRRVAEDGAAATARRISATWFRDGERSPEFAACASLSARSSEAAMVAGLRAMRDWSGEASLAGISNPSLVLWGDRDRTYAWPQTEHLWKTIPDSRLAVMPDCAHAVHLEAPCLFNRLVSGFIAPD